LTGPRLPRRLACRRRAWSAPAPPFGSTSPPADESPRAPTTAPCRHATAPFAARRSYPHIFVTAGLHDSRVGYWEPAKWVAKLRALKTDGRLLLLRTEMGAGHFSVTGRFDALYDSARELAFRFKVFGMEGTPPLPGTGPKDGGTAGAVVAKPLPPAAAMPL
jgi:hypothetical protein